jgi:hypothetical protein
VEVRGRYLVFATQLDGETIRAIFDGLRVRF